MKTDTTPKITVEITGENYKKAITESSGGCLVADAIKEQRKDLSHVSVDIGTIRVTDRKRGQRYIYLTPPSVAEMLMAFDQGWRESSLPRKLTIRNPVKIIPITRSASSVKASQESQAARRAELEAKEQRGELSHDEKRALTRLQNPKETIERPKTYGPVESAEQIGKDEFVVRGGSPPKHQKNPNLLHGRNRVFGAKTAQPGEVFKRAVKEAVAADRAKRRKKSK